MTDEQVIDAALNQVPSDSSTFGSLRRVPLDMIATAVREELGSLGLPLASIDETSVLKALTRIAKRN